MNAEENAPRHQAVIVVPHVRIQNANSVSSPLTWGFPSITAFTGAMIALERRLGANTGIALLGIGVVCHKFEAMASGDGYTKSFHLTRNPPRKPNKPPVIVEEGRAHMEVTLVFNALLADQYLDPSRRSELAARVHDELSVMRIAGGSVLPTIANPRYSGSRVLIEPLIDEREADAARKQFRRLARRWLPGFVLVSRHELLQKHLDEMRRANPDASILDAWLDLSRLNLQATEPNEAEQENLAKISWETKSRPGWIVPIPVGFAGLTSLQPPGTIKQARDEHSAFRFVEALWSIGEWINPMRLKQINDVFWEPDYESETPEAHERGLYRCINTYQCP